MLIIKHFGDSVSNKFIYTDESGKDHTFLIYPHYISYFIDTNVFCKNISIDEHHIKYWLEPEVANYLLKVLKMKVFW